MAINKINDSVGKKIVEALKMQAPEESTKNEQVEEEIQDNNVMFLDKEEAPEFSNGNSDNTKEDYSNSLNSDIQSTVQPPVSPESVQPQIKPINNQSFIDNAFAQSLAQNIGYTQVPDDFNYPANVAVLKQLIAKLPTGVSKQTGAIIIKQTMEALGIPMQSVIQEARQVQESLNNNARECQANIVDYRKQISILEAKSQQYVRLSAEMNDIISLFVQSGR
ncbi:hypothetical protein EGQ77_07305 [bacterium]|nr:hypothetical protein [bacterium]